METTAAGEGPVDRGVRPDPERAAFDAWFAAATFETLGADWQLAAWQAGAATERERWTAPVLALLAAHDASLARLGEMMRANGVTTIRIDGAAQAELDAIAVLRGLVGPNRS